MMADTMDPYLERARQQIADEVARQAEQRVIDRANHLHQIDERAAAHERLCSKHGLDPAVTTPRQLADAEIAHVNGWHSFVSCRFANSARTAEVLSPEIVDEPRRTEVLAVRDKLWKLFEAQYARDAAARAAQTGVAA